MWEVDVCWHTSAFFSSEIASWLDFYKTCNSADIAFSKKNPLLKLKWERPVCQCWQLKAVHHRSEVKTFYFHGALVQRQLHP